MLPIKTQHNVIHKHHDVPVADAHRTWAIHYNIHAQAWLLPDRSVPCSDYYKIPQVGGGEPTKRIICLACCICMAQQVFARHRASGLPCSTQTACKCTRTDSPWEHTDCRTKSYSTMGSKQHLCDSKLQSHARYVLSCNCDCTLQAPGSHRYNSGCQTSAAEALPQE